MSKMKKLLSKDKFLNLIYYASALFMPSFLLFNLYNINRFNTHLIFSHVLILAGVLAIAGILAFLLFKIVAGSIENAFFLSFLSWMLFWFFGSIHGLVMNIFPGFRRYMMFFILGAILLVVIFLFWRFKPPFTKVRPVLMVFAICLIFMFFFNFIPGMNHSITLQRNRAAGSFHIKQEFVVDEDLPSPDIHWIHLDGMMSLETVEHFWGMDVNSFRDELALRGFLIYENALLKAGFTDPALPALLSPDFYDSFLSDALQKAEGLFRIEAARVLAHSLASAGLTLYGDIFPNFELISALRAKNYDIIIPDSFGGVFSHHGSYREHSTEPHYFLGRWHYSIFMDLPELLSMTTPLDINYLLFPNRTQSASDTEHYANFTFTIFEYTHVLHWDYYPPPASWYDIDWSAVHLYPSAYEKMMEETLNYIDRIIAENPDAVIVLQSDHGFHADHTQQFLLDHVYTHEEVLELIYSVFSAVRIPAAYGGLDAPIAPLNISRELVNRFVGENYELLP